MTDLELAKILWNYHRVSGVPQPCDLILGLGSYDLRVADHCADLFHSGIAPLIVFSGAQGNWTRGRWNDCEASIFAERALTAGVPATAVLREPLATNIAENLLFTREMLNVREEEVRAITIVTKPNTLRRVSACLPLQWPEVRAYLTAPPIKLEHQISGERDLADMINEMVGDFQRILCYPEKGFTVSQPIPSAVLKAYDELVDRGFREHLMEDLPNPQQKN